MSVQIQFNSVSSDATMDILRVMLSHVKHVEITVADEPSQQATTSIEDLSVEESESPVADYPFVAEALRAEPRRKAQCCRADADRMASIQGL
jgi:hypothetical protein